ncbi:unnamed protein product [Rotaria sordida]|uniref:Nuclear receptor domain-containing protein n=1 Tax=Rotaria sordida TaxID=392033 RepID=A0A813P201_9BILA|nr:unnamed protein product [Rotaria sordida]
MSSNEYWNQICNKSSTYFEECSINFANNLLNIDINYFNIYDKTNQEDNEKISLSNKIDEYSLQTSMTNNSSAESIPLNLICGVCGAPAHGYNFDQITCESCRAFFRRNALKNMYQLECRFGGTCVINMHNRRQCTHCRLKKCFAINMRKDWIRTEEERRLRQLKKLYKQKKQLNELSLDEQQLIANLPLVVRKKKGTKSLITRQVTQELVVSKIESIYPINTFAIHRNLSNDDRILLNNIMNAYKLGADQADYSHINRCTSSTTLVQFLNDETAIYESLICFYKQIPEFKKSNLADQVLLIKSNVTKTIHLHHIIVENFQELKHIGEHLCRWINQDFSEQMLQTRKKSNYFMKYPLVLKIALIIFIFSINLSMPSSNCSQFTDYKNTRKLYESQNFYILLLWRYLNYLFNENEAIQSIQILVTQILRYQTLMSTMDEIIQKAVYQYEFNPLMQSVLRLT